MFGVHGSYVHFVCHETCDEGDQSIIELLQKETVVLCRDFVTLDNSLFWAKNSANTGV